MVPCLYILVTLFKGASKAQVGGVYFGSNLRDVINECYGKFGGIRSEVQFYTLLFLSKTISRSRVLLSAFCG